MRKIALFFRAIETHHIKFFVIDAAFATLLVTFACLPIITVVKVILLVACFIGLSYMTVEIFRLIKSEFYFSGMYDGMDKQEKYLQIQIKEMNTLLEETQILIKEMYESE